MPLAGAGGTGHGDEDCVVGVLEALHHLQGATAVLEVTQTLRNTSEVHCPQVLGNTADTQRMLAKSPPQRVPPTFLEASHGARHLGVSLAGPRFDTSEDRGVKRCHDAALHRQPCLAEREWALSLAHGRLNQPGGLKPLLAGCNPHCHLSARMLVVPWDSHVAAVEAGDLRQGCPHIRPDGIGSVCPRERREGGCSLAQGPVS